MDVGVPNELGVPTGVAGAPVADVVLNGDVGAEEEQASVTVL
jgi:hypothetical protein